MTDLGRRAAHKKRTRENIQAAADALFEERGYAETTVRDIAAAAGVTERTFFRYFTSKAALLVKEIEAWLPKLGAEIRRRPPDERPMDAVENAFLSIAPLSPDSSDTSAFRLFHDGPPGPQMPMSGPGLMLEIEQEVIDALVDRARLAPEGCGADEFDCQVIARSAVSALRSAGIRHWQLRLSTSGDRPSEGRLARRAFEVLREQGVDQRPGG